MDLLAVVTEEQNLDVYRINGQRAFGVRRKNARVAVDYICWKFNGQSIAVAWSDGLMDIISAETGKVLQKDVPPPPAGGDNQRIQCIGWGVNFIDVEAVKARTGAKGKKTKDQGPSLDFTKTDTATDDWDTLKDDTTLEDFLQRQPDLQALEIAPELPDQLAMMDMETLLPKLPALPLPPASPFPMMRAQKETGEFSSQAQVDAIFHSHHLKDHNSVDMLIRCMNNGAVHPSIYDSLETIDTNLPEEWPKATYKPFLHTSHAYSPSHTILMERRMAKSTQLALIPLTLGFIPSAGVYLHLIASKTAQIQNLLSYIQQCLQRIRAYWKHSQDLPSKFMMNVTDTLEEKGQGSLVQNLYHLACTGSCPAVIREWLVDQLSDNGHKRWDHAVMSGLTKVLDLIHENLLPAIERSSISISRLRGLAQYNDSGWIFNIPVAEFTSLQELLKNLRLLAHTVLLYAGDEKRQFAMFSKWLRYEIDFETTEPGSQSREEIEGRDPGVDTGMLLEYIQYSLTCSDLAPYLRPESELPVSKQQATPCGYDDTRKAVDLLKQGANYNEQNLCLDHQFRHFKESCGNLFSQISKWHAASTRMNTGVLLEEGEVSVVDARMVYEAVPKSFNGNDLISTYTALTMTGTKSVLHLHRIMHEPEITSFPKSVQSYSTKSFDFSPAEVLDLKFVDDENLLILLSVQPGTHDKNQDLTTTLISIPYTSTSPNVYTSHLKQDVFLPTGSPIPSRSRRPDPVSSMQMKQYTKHVFEGRFQPVKMTVNGRRERRVVVVLDRDRQHYKVLDLDFVSGKGKEKGSEREGDSVVEGRDDGDVEMTG
ncbi:hypothetical protein GQ43DRAFT_470863 [Delitschia confertaspora ATCC 74209]|uniref:Anaphase-promoting complex subunit 4 n=1 Tax=Delitschia confertaspora ATCC 74209 TaxID=1513339 RepID=A0A9P4JNE5_9PLEO|nr:hypothetical protein GQ43DRAFT_470863 [Delitschia confertaspora ATCC 74209]